MTTVLFAVNNSELPTGLLKQLIGHLPVGMQARVAKFHHWQHRQAYILGKLLLQFGLRQYDDTLSLQQVKYNVFGRPYIHNGIDFNLSHSGDYVACVISDESLVGIDIEQMMHVDITAYKKQFSIDEWALVVADHRQGYNNLFYNYWTLKEAAVKADGRGMSLPLEEVTIHDSHITIAGKSWFFIQEAIANEYAAHIVSSAKIDRPAIQRLTINDLYVNENDLNVSFEVAH